MFPIDYIHHHYAMAQCLLHFARFPKSYKFLHKFSLLLLTMFLLTFILLVTIIFGTYKALIYSLLCCIKGRNFLGILKGNDVMVVRHRGVSDALIYVYLIESEKSGEVFLKEFSEHLRVALKDSYEKLVSMRKVFMGYLYYEAVGIEDFGGGGRRQTVRFNEFFKEVKFEKSFMDEDDLGKVLDDCYNSPLPLDNRFNFDVTVCTTPYHDLKLQNCYVVIFRINHSLVDGSTMYNLLTNLLCKPKNPYSKKVNPTQQKVKHSLEATTNPFKLSNPLDSCFFSNTTQASTAFYVEKTKAYLEKIKFITKTVQENVSFSSVLMTAFSISLNKAIEENFKRENKPCEFSLTVPRQMDFERLNRMYSNEKTFEYGNDFSGFCVKLPLIHTRDLINDMKLISEYWNEALKSYDVQLNYTINLQIVNVVPHLLTYKYIVNGMKLSASVSNFPGGPKLTLFNGDEIKEKLVFANLIDQNFGLCIYTYDERLQLSLVGKKDCWSNGILKGILVGMLEAIDELENEVLKDTHGKLISRFLCGDLAKSRKR